MKVLLVDDEANLVRLWAEHIRDAGHEAVTFTSGVDALKALESGEFDVVFTDLKMVPVDGFAILAAAKQANPQTEVIVITGYGTIETAVQAMKQGAYDFITKPVHEEQFTLLLERIGEKHRLRDENRQLRQALAESDRFAEMIGKSPALERVREQVAKVAPGDTTVLILGESGVGKELVARLIHRQSPRRTKPFVVMHAAALPETLLESELFGYEKGAFTGATTRKPGRLEMAAEGTLFLDEIGELPASFQVKLLRFLQEKSFVRLGGNQTIRVDTRIIAATNRNLLDAVRQGNFREDLYYRLAVFPIQVPPLRERRSDIPLLVRHILKRLGYQQEVAADVLRLLFDYDWPGNVRELENVLERALILAGGEAIRPQHIQLPEPVLVQAGQLTQSGQVGLLELERRMLEDALRKAGGNKSKAAKMLGITRRMLYTKLAKFGIAYEEEE
ncbi:MAG: sigma-54 dependent transcriptional regulator [candidate division WOR-3 bacterium]